MAQLLVIWLFFNRDPPHKLGRGVKIGNYSSQMNGPASIGDGGRAIPPQENPHYNGANSAIGLQNVGSIAAILWDFGGVFTTSPFEAFAHFESEAKLPENIIRLTLARNHHSNAWSQLEAGKISEQEFDRQFRTESRNLGHEVAGDAVLRALSKRLRPRVVAALALCKHHFKVGCITNNVHPIVEASTDGNSLWWDEEVGSVFAMFDTVVESCVEGVRKPDPQIYQIACSRLEVTPDACVFLDDLGINLKTARLMGMTTIKVQDPDEALKELAEVTGLTFP